MDGQPLRYRPNPDGTFLLYSVDLDGRDDGGKPHGGTGGTNGNDLIWHIPERTSDGH
jgi:hypothetical protein